MKRIVLKVGSAVLTEEGRIAKERMRALVAFIASLKQRYEVVLVSSGAVASGYTYLHLDKKIVSNRQALAAIGQPLLMSIYQKKMGEFGIVCAQMLLTADDFDSRKRTTHAKNAIETLLQNGVLPIINENDVTATEELVFGDNDQLSAHVAFYFDADLLVILSDIDGYYDKDPRKYADAVLRKEVNAIEPFELEAQMGGSYRFATGGIVTKLKAADFMLSRGRQMFLASGFNLEDAKSFLIDGVHKKGTIFRPAGV